MTSLATPSRGLDIGSAFRERARGQTCVSLFLRATADGWSLLAPDGELVFHAPGSGGRRRCLAFARAHGVLTLRS